MRTWLESGLVVLIGAAWAAFGVVLAVGPTRGERVGAARFPPGAEARTGAGGEGSRLLGKDEVARLPGRGPGVVQVEAGLVWVTREGDPVDHVLGPGEALALPGPGLALAWALEPSRIAVRSQDGSLGASAECAAALR